MSLLVCLSYIIQANIGNGGVKECFKFKDV